MKHLPKIKSTRYFIKITTGKAAKYLKISESKARSQVLALIFDYWLDIDKEIFRAILIKTFLPFSSNQAMQFYSRGTANFIELHVATIRWIVEEF